MGLTLSRDRVGSLVGSATTGMLTSPQTLTGLTAALRELFCHVVTDVGNMQVAWVAGRLGACLPARPPCRIASIRNPFH
jgi:hypothetical protein